MPADPVDTTGVFVEYRSYRLPLVISLLIIGMLLAVVSAGAVAEQRLFNPERTVSAYFDALADRDAAAARDLLRLEIPEPGLELDETLLQQVVLRSDGYTPPTAVRVGEAEPIEDVEKSGDRVSVGVSYEIAGVRHEQRLELRSEDEKTGGIFRRWRIDGGLYPVDLSAFGFESVVVAGATVPFSGAPGSTTMAAFPGEYVVAAPDDPLLTATPTRVTAGGSFTASGWEGTWAAQLEATVRPEAQAEIGRQIEAYLGECAASTDLNPPGCPFGPYHYYEVRDVKWTIVAQPEFVVEFGAGLPGPARAEVRTLNPGEAEVTGVEEGFSGPADYTDTVSFYVSGTVLVSGGVLVFEPDSP